MESERDNAGFYIYRSAKGGELLVSDLIPGSSFKVGDQPEYNQEYVFFDPAGSIYSIYTIESQSMKGTRVRSSAVAAAYTHDISEIKGGDDLIAVAKSKGQNTIQLNNDLLLSNELRTEVTSGLVAADIDKHREVIAQPGARIAAKSTGIVRVTKAQLLAAGFDANADPTNWQLYLDGVERPIIVGPGSDYIEFLGKKLDTLESDLRMYYLIVGSGPGKRMATTFFRPTFSTVKSRKYPEKIAFAERTFYVNQILNGDLENYWGRVIASGLTSPVNLNLTAIDRAPGTRAMTVDIQGFSPTFHSVEVTLNGVVLGNIEGSGSQAFSGEFQVPVELLIDGVNALRMRSIGAAGDISLFNRVSIDLSRGYVAVNDRLDFPTENYRTTTLSGFSSPNVRLFDVTFEDQPKLVNNVQMVQTNGTWGPYIPAHRGRVYYAAGETSFGSPISVTSNDPEVLRSPTQSGTLLIISHGSLMAQAQNWANYRSSQGTITKVVNVEEIYDEFNYGSLSSFAVEDFL
ncbi:MAG TPA: C25 family cysteine peptidase, partial [Pyrinomonadaceae bacterium]|nr:C25 family cysteine peptidase [Pyrinomonadaceae bacterium]